MRTTIELPDELMTRAKVRAAQSGWTLKEFFERAVEEKLAEGPKKPRLDPPVVGGTEGPPIRLTREQIDEAMFG